jgi:hypothetical protein
MFLPNIDVIIYGLLANLYVLSCLVRLQLLNLVLKYAYVLVRVLMIPIFPLGLLIQLGINGFLIFDSFLKVVFLLVLFDFVYILDVLCVFPFLCL